MKNNILRIYEDLDGCLTDFDKQVFKYTGKKTEEFDQKDFYKVSADFSVEFWANMEWMPDGKTLWNYLINNFENIKILSTPSEPWKKQFNKSIIGKNLWIKRELGLDDDKIILSDRKEQYVNPNEPSKDVLIDDRLKNIAKWNGVGGIGIQHVSAWNTIEKLKQIK